MSVHSEAILNQKFFEMIKLLKIYLNHFPKDEKFALCLSIRNTAYEVFDLITESQKRYYKKTSLTNLDIKHEQLRMKIYLANELGYFNFKDGRREDGVDGRHKYLAISKFIDEIGRAIKKGKIESIISLVGHAKGTATLRYFRNLLIEFSLLEKLPKRTQICLNM